MIVLSRWSRCRRSRMRRCKFFSQNILLTYKLIELVQFIGWFYWKKRWRRIAKLSIIERSRSWKNISIIITTWLIVFMHFNITRLNVEFSKIFIRVHNSRIMLCNLTDVAGSHMDIFRQLMFRLETRVIIKITKSLAILQTLTDFHRDEAKKNLKEN